MDALIQQRIECGSRIFEFGFAADAAIAFPCPANEIAFSTPECPWFCEGWIRRRFSRAGVARKMARIPNCILCGACKTRCPYELDTPELLKKSLCGLCSVVSEWDAAH